MNFSLFDLIFPPRCPICDGLLPVGSRHIPHVNCLSKIEKLPSPYCFSCGKPILNYGYELCLNCTKKKHAFSQGRSAFLYQGAMKHSMYQFKYNGRVEYAEWYVSTTLQMYGRWLKNMHADVLIPVPMYGPKKRKRGYNQAEIFAKVLAKETGLPCDLSLVKRVRDTTPQKLLSYEERKRNLRNAFILTKNSVSYRRIVLIDDIFTTGSTIDSLGKTLLEGGADEIFFLCICTGKDI